MIGIGELDMACSKEMTVIMKQTDDETNKRASSCVRPHTCAAVCSACRQWLPDRARSQHSPSAVLTICTAVFLTGVFSQSTEWLYSHDSPLSNAELYIVALSSAS